MKTIIIKSNKYKTVEEICNYIKEHVSVDVISIDAIKHCDIENYDNIVFISSIYFGKSIHNSKLKIKNLYNRINDKNIFLAYCSYEEKEKYLNNCYDEKTISIANSTYWFGYSINRSSLGFIAKIFIKFFIKAEKDNNINYDSIDNLISKLT